MCSHERTLVVAVIGVSGSGKSAFINVASGSDSLADKTESVANPTISLKSSTFPLDGRTVTLIDTPGFGDASPSVLEVLKLISDHFSRLYREGVKLGGVIYMHCLAEDRMRNRSSNNFRAFSKFCGGTVLRDVLIVSNKEGFTDKDAFFELVEEKDARMLYHDGSQASAHAILRYLLSRDRTALSPQGNPPDERVEPARTMTDTDALRSLTGQIGHHTKAFGELYRRIDTTTLAEDEKKVVQAEANNSLQKIEHIRFDLEQLVVNIATEKSRLEDENRWYRTDFAAQKAEAELRVRLLGEERRAREAAEASRERAEIQLAEERALLERQRIERERPHNVGGLKYDKLFAGSALILLAFCVSQFAFHGSPL